MSRLPVAQRYHGIDYGGKKSRFLERMEAVPSARLPLAGVAGLKAEFFTRLSPDAGLTEE